MSRLATVSIVLFIVGCALSEAPFARPTRPSGASAPPPVHSPGRERATGARVDREAIEEESNEDEPEQELPHRAWESLLRRYRPEFYDLDYLPRAARRDRRGHLDCPDVDIERYRGESIRYRRTVWVHPAFRERLKRFERIASRVGREVYGRAPDRLFQRGTLVCKVIHHRKHRFSEHAFGNAIDLIALGFPPLPRNERADTDAPGRRFRISVEDDWDGTEGYARLHSIFWKRIVKQLRAHRVFRGMITPPAAGHHDHLHFDMAPTRYFRGDLTLPAGEPQADTVWAR